MVEKKTLIKVTNRDNGSVGYTIPDLGNLHRNFQSGETKEITMEELTKLSYIPGGMAILKNYLLIDNEEAVKELLSEVEPEYFWTEADVKNLLATGSLDEFKDCLDFAPEGTVNLIKKLAVELELNDVAKRQALLEMTGFNVTAAIAANATDEDEDEDSTTKKRRTSRPTSVSTTATTGRRTSNYKIINK